MDIPVTAMGEMLQPLWDKMKEGGMTPETEKFVKYFMEQATRQMNEMNNLDRKKAELDIAKARLEGAQEATLMLLHGYLDSIKSTIHAAASNSGSIIE